jgi:hypothetical protein
MLKYRERFAKNAALMKAKGTKPAPAAPPKNN